MPNYKKMYYELFNAVTDMERQLRQAADVLKTAQQDAEEIYIKTEEDGSDT